MLPLVHDIEDKAHQMTKEEFVEELTIMFKRSKRGEVLGYLREEDFDLDMDDEGADVELGSLLIEAFGRLCVDDSDDVPVRSQDQYGGQRTETPLYPLDEINAWKPGLFEKLSRLHWRIARDDEINPLDAIERATR